MHLFQSLKQLLIDNLKVHRILSVDEVIRIAEKNNYKASNAERRLRNDSRFSGLPIKKLNRFKHPIKNSERIYYYVWLGRKNKFKPFEDFKPRSARKNSVSTQRVQTTK